jgi:hypothetical protein
VLKDRYEDLIVERGGKLLLLLLLLLFKNILKR